MATFQPVPTYADPVMLVKDQSGKSVFNPVWLNWFLELTKGGLGAVTQHNSLAGVQGGASGDYYHVTAAQHSTINYRNSGAVAAITVTASPFTFQNTHGYDIDVIVTGGTTTTVAFSRDNATYYTVGLPIGGVVDGMYRLSPNDYLKVTYTVAPTMVEVPR